MFPLIVTDIGGTNARFSLVIGKESDSGAYVFTEQQIFSSAHYDSFQEALTDYIVTLKGLSPKNMCVAIAGPVQGDIVVMTNVNWSFSIASVKRDFSFKNFEVINDFAALACSLPLLQERDMTTVKEGKNVPLASKIVVGPGTGLGMASLIYTDDRWFPVAGEGGHAGFAPATDLQFEVFKVLKTKKRHVSLESLLCGSGLVNIYNTLGLILDKPVTKDDPAKIVEAALSYRDSLSRESLHVFCRVLGSAAGDMALTCGARGGVYLAGGMLPRYSDFLINSDFTQAFTNKGVMSDYLKNIPVSLITHQQPAFIGAAAWTESKMQ